MDHFFLPEYNPQVSCDSRKDKNTKSSRPLRTEAFNFRGTTLIDDKHPTLTALLTARSTAVQLIVGRSGAGSDSVHGKFSQPVEFTL